MAADKIIDASKMDICELVKLKDTRPFEYFDFSFLEIMKIGSLFPKKEVRVTSELTVATQQEGIQN
jgi:hypothetical protein